MSIHAYKILSDNRIHIAILQEKAASVLLINCDLIERLSTNLATILNFASINYNMFTFTILLSHNIDINNTKIINNNIYNKP